MSIIDADEHRFSWLFSEPFFPLQLALFRATTRTKDTAFCFFHLHNNPLVDHRGISLYMVGTHTVFGEGICVLFREVSLIQGVLYKEVPL